LNTRIFYIILGCCWLALSSCHQKQKSTASSAVNQQQNKAANDLFFKGIQFKNQQKWTQSAEAFDAYIQMMPKEGAAHYELARIQREQLLLPNDALGHAMTAYLLDKNNKWYVLEMARCYNSLNKLSDAVKWYEKAHLLDTQWTLPLFEWTDALSRSGKTIAAIEVLNKIEKINGKEEYLTEYKFQLYFQSQDLKSAANELESLALAFPKEAQFTIKAAEFYQQIGLNDKALALLKRNHLEENGYYHFLLYNIATTQNSETLENFDHLQKAMSSSDVNMDQRVAALYPYLYHTNGKEKDEIIARCIDLTTQVFPNDPKGYSMKGDFMATLHQEKEAVLAYEKTLQLDPSKSAVWIALLSIYESSYDLDPKEWQKKAQEAIDIFNFAPEFYKSKYKAEYRLGAFSSMIESCDAGLAILIDDEREKAIFQLDKIFALGAIGKIKEAQSLALKVFQTKNAETSGLIVQNLLWLSVYFHFSLPEIEGDVAQEIKNEKSSRYFKNAYQIQKGNVLQGEDFNKTEYYDALMAHQYFAQKNDLATGCVFLQLLKENLKWNQWIHQLQPTCP